MSEFNIVNQWINESMTRVGIELQGQLKIPWRCQIVCCVKLSAVSNYPRCQIVRGVKLSAVSNCPRCQIVRCQIVRCQIVHIVKLSGVKLSMLSNCPGVKLSTLSNFPVSNCHRTNPLFDRQAQLFQLTGWFSAHSCWLTNLLILSPNHHFCRTPFISLSSSSYLAGIASSSSSLSYLAQLSSSSTMMFHDEDDEEEDDDEDLQSGHYFPLISHQAEHATRAEVLRSHHLHHHRHHH